MRRRLRHDLMLLGLALVALMAAGSLWAARQTLGALQLELRKQVTSQPFQFMQSQRLRKLRSAAYQISYDAAFLEALRRFRGTIGERLDKLAAAGAEQEMEQVRNSDPNFRSLCWDVALRAFIAYEPGPGEELVKPLADLFVLTTAEGTVLVEHRSLSEPPAQAGLIPVVRFPLPEHVPAPSRPALTGLEPIHAILEEQAEEAGGYLLYPDGRLYLAAAVPIVKGDYLDGIILVGDRLDDRAAQWASLTSIDSDVFVLSGNGLEGGFAPDIDPGLAPPGDNPDIKARLAHGLSNPAARALGESLLARGLQPQDGYQQFRLGGADYLATSLPLARSLDLTSGLPRPGAEPVGQMVWMKPMQAVQAAYQRQAWLVVLGAGLSALLALGLGLGLARRISSPIEALAELMRKVGQGDLEVRAQVTGAREVAQAAEAFNDMVTGLRRKKVLEKFVPRQTREEVELDAEAAGPRRTAERVRATIMFSDIRGFTSLSEKLPPLELVTILSEYLDEMTGVVYAHHGDINEYIGDAILAVFYDRDQTSSGCLAVSAALEMNRRLAELQSRTDNPHLQGLRQGIGINTGILVTGNIGNVEERMKTAVIGDTVNLAARIQDRSRDGRHTCILVSQATYEEIEAAFPCAFFGNESFKGKSEPQPVWEVRGPS